MEYRILYSAGSGIYEEKKSRFLATACPVNSEEEVQRILAEERKKYWDARHHCYAYCIGSRGELSRFSDDGEPGGTAGRPILDVIQGSGITNQLIVVTRYFGGVLLGTGGLVRAYGSAAKAALASAEAVTVYEGEEWQLLCDYGDLSKLEKALDSMGLCRGDKEFGTDVSLKLYLKAGEAEALLPALAEATAGSGIAEKLRELRFAERDGKAVFL